MKIAVDIGHNCYPDIGASAIGNEDSMVKDVGNRLIPKLQALGHSVLLVTPTSASSVTDSLAQRVNSANSWGADQYVSLHENAGGGQGTEVWIGSESSRTMAQNIANSIAALGFTNRGVKVQGVDGPHLYVLNYTNMPALLVEGCFVDSQSDMNRFNAENMANAICKGITGSVPSPDASIQQLQHLLNVYGYRDENGNTLVEDGIAGSHTRYAAGTCIIQYGSQGDIVKWVQNRLISKGYPLPIYGADGFYGSEMYNAVTSFQRNHGLTADGIIGPSTWNALLD